MVILILIVVFVGIVCAANSFSSPSPRARSRRGEDSAPQPEPSDEPWEPVLELEDTIMVATADADGEDTVCKIRVPVQQEVFTPPMPQGTYYKLMAQDGFQGGEQALSV